MLCSHVKSLQQEYRVLELTGKTLLLRNLRYKAAKKSNASDILQYIFHFSKRIITVGSAVPSTSHVIIASPNLAHEMRVRVSCGHCNEIFIVSKPLPK